MRSYCATPLCSIKEASGDQYSVGDKSYNETQHSPSYVHKNRLSLATTSPLFHSSSSPSNSDVSKARLVQSITEFSSAESQYVGDLKVLISVLDDFDPRYDDYFDDCVEDGDELLMIKRRQQNDDLKKLVKKILVKHETLVQMLNKSNDLSGVMTYFSRWSLEAEPLYSKYIASFRLHLTAGENELTLRRQPLSHISLIWSLIDSVKDSVFILGLQSQKEMQDLTSNVELASERYRKLSKKAEKKLASEKQRSQKVVNFSSVKSLLSLLPVCSSFTMSSVDAVFASQLFYKNERLDTAVNFQRTELMFLRSGTSSKLAVVEIGHGEKSLLFPPLRKGEMLLCDQTKTSVFHLQHCLSPDVEFYISLSPSDNGRLAEARMRLRRLFSKASVKSTGKIQKVGRKTTGLGVTKPIREEPVREHVTPPIGSSPPDVDEIRPAPPVPAVSAPAVPPSSTPPKPMEISNKHPTKRLSILLADESDTSVSSPASTDSRSDGSQPSPAAGTFAAHLRKRAGFLKSKKTKARHHKAKVAQPVKKYKPVQSKPVQSKPIQSKRVQSKPVEPKPQVVDVSLNPPPSLHSTKPNNTTAVPLQFIDERSSSHSIRPSKNSVKAASIYSAQTSRSNTVNTSLLDESIDDSPRSGASNYKLACDVLKSVIENSSSEESSPSILPCNSGNVVDQQMTETHEEEVYEEPRDKIMVDETIPEDDEENESSSNQTSSHTSPHESVVNSKPTDTPAKASFDPNKWAQTYKFALIDASKQEKKEKHGFFHAFKGMFGKKKHAEAPSSKIPDVVPENTIPVKDDNVVDEVVEDSPKLRMPKPSPIIPVKKQEKALPVDPLLESILSAPTQLYLQDVKCSCWGKEGWSKEMQVKLKWIYTRDHSKYIIGYNDEASNNSVGFLMKFTKETFVKHCKACEIQVRGKGYTGQSVSIKLTSSSVNNLHRLLAIFTTGVSDDMSNSTSERSDLTFVPKSPSTETTVSDSISEGSSVSDKPMKFDLSKTVKPPTPDFFAAHPNGSTPVLICPPEVEDIPVKRDSVVVYRSTVKVTKCTDDGDLKLLGKAALKVKDFNSETKLEYLIRNLKISIDADLPDDAIRSLEGRHVLMELNDGATQGSFILSFAEKSDKADFLTVTGH